MEIGTFSLGKFLCPSPHFVCNSEGKMEWFYTLQRQIGMISQFLLIIPMPTVDKRIWTSDPSLRSKALGTLLLVYRCLMKFLKSLDLRGFLAIVGTWLSVLIWSRIGPVLACFVCKMLAWANLVLSTELPNSKNWVLITTPIDLSATDSVLSRNW